VRIHKEGIKPTIILLIFLVLINIPFMMMEDHIVLLTVVQSVSLLLLVFNLMFFRKPSRKVSKDAPAVVAPADGTVLIVKETSVSEYFNDKRIQVSIFMSVWNVHINWFPVNGEIVWQKYFPGRYLVARLPKSSEENERNTTVIRTKDGAEILVRQIAGTVARRIITYGKTGQSVCQGEEMGFIRYGSRVDLILPLNSWVFIRPGDQVTGGITHIARYL
jgi:phosphatidylserine decarboxylase